MQHNASLLRKRAEDLEQMAEVIWPPSLFLHLFEEHVSVLVMHQLLRTHTDMRAQRAPQAQIPHAHNVTKGS